MKKALLLIFFIYGVLLLSGCSESSNSYARGLSYSADGRYREAMEAFLLSESQGNRSTGLYFDMAYASYSAGDAGKAEEYYEKGLALMEDGADGRDAIKAGRFLQKSGRIQEALQSYVHVFSGEDEVSSRKKEVESEARGYYGTALMSTGDSYERAIETFNILIDGGFYPMEHEILAGACYLRLSQVQAACQYFDLAAERKEIQPEHYLKIYQLLYEAGAYTPAETYFEKGLELCGKKEMMSAREYCLRAGKTELSESYAKDAEDTDTLLLVASLLVDQGEYEKAESVYQELTLRGEKLPEVYCDYMRLKVLTGAYDNALQLYTEVQQSDDPGILSEGAWNEIILYEKKGDFRTAFDRISSYRKNYGTTEEILREYVFLERVLRE